MQRTCLLYVVGTRFGLGTMAPVIAAMRRRSPRARHAVVVTGEAAATEADLSWFGLAEPDYLFSSSPASPVTATTTAMEKIERVVALEQPSLVVVSGDSTAALAAALTALKLEIRCAHVDAGLRNFDRRLPAEINRVIIDSFADLLFVSCEHGMANLRAESIDPRRIHLVGSTMVDTFNGLGTRLDRSSVASRLGLDGDDYLLAALRDSTFAPGRRLPAILDRLADLSATMPVVLPTPAGMRETVGRHVRGSAIRLAEPLDYLGFLALEAGAAAVLTNHGGVQAETTHLGLPCFTLAASTERVTTLLRGTNRLLGNDPVRIAEIPAALRERRDRREPPPFWDGRAADRIADVLVLEPAPEPPAPIAVASGMEVR